MFFVPNLFPMSKETVTFFYLLFCTFLKFWYPLFCNNLLLSANKSREVSIFINFTLLPIFEMGKTKLTEPYHTQHLFFSFCRHCLRFISVPVYHSIFSYHRPSAMYQGIHICTSVRRTQHFWGVLREREGRKETKS